MFKFLLLKNQKDMIILSSDHQYKESEALFFLTITDWEQSYLMNPQEKLAELSQRFT